MNNKNKTIEDIAVSMRTLASEIGGGHHSLEEAEQLLKDLSWELSYLNVEMSIMLHSSLLEYDYTLAGVSEKCRNLYLRQQNIKEHEQKEAKK